MHQPHEWIVVENKENRGISAIYAEAKERAKHDLVVFLHPDVLLPRDFYADLMRRLAELEAHDPNWGAAGAVGLLASDSTVIQNLQDSYGTRRDSNTDRSLEAASAFDELMLMLRKSSGVNFDPNFPGYDLYGVDIALQSQARNLTAYVLPVYVEHKVYDPEGALYVGKQHWSKILTDRYVDRVARTAEYLTTKWCDRGLLKCSIGTVFYLNCDDRRPRLRNYVPQYVLLQAKESKWKDMQYNRTAAQECWAANGIANPVLPRVPPGWKPPGWKPPAGGKPGQRRWDPASHRAVPVQ